LRSVDWDYDSFTRKLTLTKDAHKVILMAGEKMVMADNRSYYLKHPVVIHQGAIAVPYKFKEQIFDVIFKAPSPAAARAPVIPAWIKTVVIDPGHGGNDPGAIGKRALKEKDINLDIAKRVATLLRASGVSVIMTRSSDNFVSLSRRVAISNRAHPDLFVSIHSNANRVRSLNGLEVYYISPKVNDSKRAASAAQNGMPDVGVCSVISNPSYNLKAILWDMVYTANRAESIRLARAICRSTGRNMDTRIIGVKGAPFYVLKGVSAPAILIETGFVSNPAEEKLLRNSYYRQQIAESIVEGIRDYGNDSLS